MSTQSDNTAELVSFRLSPQQELLRAVVPAGAVTQVAVALDGPIDADALAATLTRASERHEILRTTIVTPTGVRAPQQVIHDRVAPEWSERELGEGPGTAEALAATLAAEAATLDVERGPLVRGLLLRSDDAGGVLVLSACAEIADSPSLIALVEELRGSGPHEPSEPIQFADYAEWRHQLLVEPDEAAAEDRSHWSSADWPAAPRLLHATAAATPSPATAPIAVDLDAGTRDALGRVAGGAAPFVEAAWHALIGRLTGTGELMLAHGLDGRAQDDLIGAVGPYAQAVPLRTRTEAETTFAEIVDQVRRARADAPRRQDLASGEQLAALVRSTVAAFAQLDAPAALIAATPSPAGFPLLLQCLTSGDDVRLVLHHDPASVDAEDAAQVAGSLTLLLAAAARDPGAAVASLPLIGADERARLLAGDDAAPAAAADLVHHRFEQQAQRTPDRPALAGPGGERSYRELNEDANRLAHHLRECGVGPGVAVGICLERTPATVTALLATLKAGGAYVPLNLEHPAARIADQLARARAQVLVTHEHLLERLGDAAATVVSLERDADAIARRPAADPAPTAGAQDLVYVMYTSGSTGLPKGVEVTHANLANYTARIADAIAAAAGPEPPAGLQYAVVSAISTDLGNTAIFPALATGGCLHLIDPSAAMDGDAYATYVGDGHPIDILKITPSHLRALLGAARPADVLPRRMLFIGGEALSWELVERLRELGASCRLVNHYGPTETTVGCCTYDVGERRADAATVPIGAPIGGARAYVLDGRGEPVPAGVPGELVVGGAGVARGYAGDPAETAERFVADPGDAGGRAYRTGDRVRRLRDRAIEFLGRVDDQVKIRGYRVEPGEIEAVLARHPQVRQAAVAVDDASGEARLVAYLVAAQEPSVEELQTFLSASLPDYMIPSAFATLEALPFTASGKIDRRSLAGIAAVQTRRETAFVAPRDEIEHEIAAIWCELLGVEQVGVFDDFFALGGHSLLATQAIIRIRRGHGEIPLRALLAAPTVAAVADVVRSAGGSAG